MSTPAQPIQPAPSSGPVSGDDKTLAVLAHLSPIIALVLSAGWLSILGPLIVWLIFRGRGGRQIILTIVQLFLARYVFPRHHHRETTIPHIRLNPTR